MEKVIVQFIKGDGRYVSGDITQLERSEAEKLLKSRMVIILDGDCNVVSNTPDYKLPPLPTDKFICPICGKEFEKLQALKMHKLKAHGVNG